MRATGVALLSIGLLGGCSPGACDGGTKGAAVAPTRAPPPQAPAGALLDRSADEPSRGSDRPKVGTTVLVATKEGWLAELTSDDVAVRDAAEERLTIQATEHPRAFRWLADEVLSADQPLYDAIAGTVSYLGKSDPEVRRRVLERFERAPTNTVRARALTVMGCGAWPDADRRVLAAMTDGSGNEVQWAAVLAFASNPELCSDAAAAEVETQLVRLLGTSDSARIRISCANALWINPNPGETVAPALLARAADLDENERVRMSAVLALRRFADPGLASQVRAIAEVTEAGLLRRYAEEAAARIEQNARR